MTVFQDRRQAGQELGKLLVEQFGGRDDVVVLALPRGGVPVGHEIAAALAAPLDVLVVRKLGVPWQPELAMGAIASGGAEVLNREVLASVSDPETALTQARVKARTELAEREQAYRGDRKDPALAGKTVLLVDDGVATGATMMVAIQALLTFNPASVVVAVPVAARESLRAIDKLADAVVCLDAPSPFFSVGQWYRVFDQTSDSEVRQLLQQAEPTTGRGA